MISTFSVKRRLWNLGFLLISLVLLSSCASKKNVLYFQDLQGAGVVKVPQSQAIIEKDDILSIIVSAENSEIAKPFNLPAISIEQGNTIVGAQRNQAYLVDSEGKVELPKIGAIEIAGLTRIQAQNKIKELLKVYINNPIVTLRILNFRITVLGDVSNPGTFTVPNENINIIEAIGLAGDMTITGDREKVMVIREAEEGKQITGILDFTNSDLFSSPFYNLKQNDIVVVDPNYYKVQRSVANPNTGIFVSIASLLLSLIVILIR